MSLRILYVLPYYPFSLRSGSSFRASNIIRRLSRSHDVHVLCLGYDHRTDPEMVSTAERCASIDVIPYRHSRIIGGLRTLATFRPYDLATHESAEFRRRLRQSQKRLAPDVVYYSRSSAAQYHCREGKAIHVADQHDLLESFWKLASSGARSAPFRLFAKFNAHLTARIERRIYSLFDGVISVSAEELAKTRAMLPSSVRTFLLPNGADTDYFQASNTDVQGDGKRAVMVGAMSAQRNADAAIDFATRIFPAIRETHPDATFQIVGHRPTPAVKALARIPGVNVTGEVPDVRPYIESATVIVAPFWSGSGVKHKVPIAMSMSKACVITPNAAQGLHIGNGEQALIAENQIDFANAVTQLFEQPQTREKLGSAARELVLATYSWDALVLQLEQWLSQLAKDSSTRHRENGVALRAQPGKENGCD